MKQALPNDVQNTVSVLCALHNQCTCPICFDVMQEPRLLPCTHVFCASCISRALENRQHCPLCNQPVRSLRLLIPVPQLDAVLRAGVEALASLRYHPAPADSLSGKKKCGGGCGVESAINSSSLRGERPRQCSERSTQTDRETERSRGSVTWIPCSEGGGGVEVDNDNKTAETQPLMDNTIHHNKKDNSETNSISSKESRSLRKRGREEEETPLRHTAARRLATMPLTPPPQTLDALAAEETLIVDEDLATVRQSDTSERRHSKSPPKERNKGGYQCSAPMSPAFWVLEKVRVRARSHLAREVSGKGADEATFKGFPTTPATHDNDDDEDAAGAATAPRDGRAVDEPDAFVELCSPNQLWRERHSCALSSKTLQQQPLRNRSDNNNVKVEVESPRRKTDCLRREKQHFHWGGTCVLCGLDIYARSRVRDYLSGLVERRRKTKCSMKSLQHLNCTLLGQLLGPLWGIRVYQGIQKQHSLSHPRRGLDNNGHQDKGDVQEDEEDWWYTRVTVPAHQNCLAWAGWLHFAFYTEDEASLEDTLHKVDEMLATLPHTLTATFPAGLPLVLEDLGEETREVTSRNHNPTNNRSARCQHTHGRSALQAGEQTLLSAVSKLQNALLLSSSSSAPPSFSLFHPGGKAAWQRFCSELLSHVQECVTLVAGRSPANPSPFIPSDFFSLPIAVPIEDGENVCFLCGKGFTPALDFTPTTSPENNSNNKFSASSRQGRVDDEGESNTHQRIGGSTTTSSNPISKTRGEEKGDYMRQIPPFRSCAGLRECQDEEDTRKGGKRSNRRTERCCHFSCAVLAGEGSCLVYGMEEASMWWGRVRKSSQRGDAAVAAVLQEKDPIEIQC